MKGAVLLMHISETLPDSLKARKAILRDALDVFPEESELRPQIGLMLRSLEEHEKSIARLQSELPLDFPGKK